MKIDTSELRREYSRELYYYSKFHRNASNQLIHSISIPVEVLSWLLVLAVINEWVSYLVAGAMALYCVETDSKCALISALAHLFLAIVAHVVYTHIHSRSYTLILALILQVVAWLTQVCIGHHYFEKNQPGFFQQLTFNSVAWSVLLAWDLYFIGEDKYA